MAIIAILILQSLLVTAFLKPVNLVHTAQAFYKIDLQSLSLLDDSLPDVSLPEVASSAIDSSNKFGTPEKLEMLVRDADIIMRGRVISQESHWNSDKTDIETDTLIKPLYTISGNTPNPLTIRSKGGILQDEGFATHDSEAVTFEIGQEVLVFAYEEDSYYRVVQEQRGKFLVGSSIAVNEAQRIYTALHMFYSEIRFHLLNLERPVLLPYGWDDIEPDTEEVIIGQGYLYNERRWETKEVKYKVNINTNQASTDGSSDDGKDNGSVEDFLNAVITAGNTWTRVNTSDFKLIYDGLTDNTETGINGSNDIVFEHRGAEEAVAKARYWFDPSTGVIQEADIWLNDDFQWNANGKPEEYELDLQTAVLHEMGHWLALGHDTTESSIMYFSLPGGTTKRSLHDNDRGGITFIYPCQQGDCIPDGLDSDVTSTPTPTSTSTSRPTATPTRRPTSTPKPTTTQTSISSPTSAQSSPTPTLIPTRTPTLRAIPSSTATLFPTPTSTKTVGPIQQKLTPPAEPGESIEPTKTVEPTETVEPDNSRARPSYAIEVQSRMGGNLSGQIEQLLVNITIPPETTEEDVVLLLEYAEPDGIDDVELFGPAFNINVNDKNGASITQFAPPLELILTYSGLLPAEEVETALHKRIHLGYWNTEAMKWVTVPSQIDRSRQQIEAKLDHLTTFAILVGDPYRAYLPIILE